MVIRGGKMRHSNDDEYTNLDYLKDVNDRIYEQLSYAEAKHAVLIGFIGAAIFALIGIIIDIGTNSLNLLWLQIWIGVIVGLLILPLGVSLSSFSPNTKKKDTGKGNNLYFYGDISKYKSVELYLDEIINCSDIERHLASQNMQVSLIITKKHSKFILALNLCFASFFPLHYIGTVILMIKHQRQNSDKKCSPD